MVYRLGEVIIPVVLAAVDWWKMEKKHYRTQDASFRITDSVRTFKSCTIYSKLSIEDIWREDHTQWTMGCASGWRVHKLFEFIPWDQQQLAETQLYQTQSSPNYLVAPFSQIAAFTKTVRSKFRSVQNDFFTCFDRGRFSSIPSMYMGSVCFVHVDMSEKM